MKATSLWLSLVGLATNMLTLAADDVAMTQYTSYAQVQASEALKAIIRPGDDIAAATELAKHVVPGAQFRLMNDHHVSSDGVAHVYFRQTWDDTDIEHRVFNVNVKDGAIFSFGENFERSLAIPSNATHIPSHSTIKRAAADAVNALNAVIRTNNLDVTMADVKTEALGENGAVTIKGVNGTLNNPQAELVYTLEAGRLISTWKIQVSTKNSTLVSYVNAQNTEELFNTLSCVSNYVAAFEVYPWNVSSPDKGSRQVVEDPWDITASPFTWVGDGDGVYYDTTRGNNAIAGVDKASSWREPDDTNREPSYFPTADAGRTFQYPYEADQENAEVHRDASITQAFYTINKYHDLLYVLGFDEKAGNFQQNNNNKGGKEHDPVLVLVHDIQSTGFYAPDDGTSPVMFLADDYNFPRDMDDSPRDPSMDASVLIHEYTHGMTSRLTGGPASSFCVLSPRETDFDVRGLNEGWSDFAFLAAHLKPSDNRTMQSKFAQWSSPRDGSRLRPYTTDMGVNDLKYGETSQMISNPYHIGNFWATTLYEVLWNLVDKRGMTDKDVPEMDSRGVPTDGRYYTLKLVMHAMMLQPCFPNLINARDAILDADLALSGGENQCEIWRAFAKRGLGQLATYEKKTFDSPSRRIEDFSVPDNCNQSTGSKTSAPSSSPTQLSTTSGVASEPSETSDDSQNRAHGGEGLLDPRNL